MFEAKSEHQMRQAAAAANQAERLQQVAEEKALLKIEYVRKEEDARLAALNARREPAAQGTQYRVKNDDDDDGLGETNTPEIFIIFKNKFKLINSYKLRHLGGFEDTRDEDSIVVENGPLKPRKTTGTYKDFSQPSMRSGREAFLNYMLVINILFGTPEILASLVLFYRKIIGRAVPGQHFGIKCC